MKWISYTYVSKYFDLVMIFKKLCEEKQISWGGRNIEGNIAEIRKRDRRKKIMERQK